LAILSRCAAAVFAIPLLPVPASGQTLAQDAEPLIASSQNVDSGMALARRQMADNDLLGAVATLERVLIQNPDSVGPRLLYVSLLCRLDDHQGASVELNMMPKRSVPDANWAEVTAACGAMPRPGTKQSK
jgi:hypothetical protein